MLAKVIRQTCFTAWLCSGIVLLGCIQACTAKAPLLDPSTQAIVENPEDEKPFEAMDSLDPSVRARAAEILGNLSPVKNHHMTAFLESLNQSDASGRVNAVRDMKDMADNMVPVIDVLGNGSRDFDPRVRLASLESLGMIATELSRPVTALETIRAESSTSPVLMETARKSLDSIEARIIQINQYIQDRAHDGDRKVGKTARKILGDLNLPVESAPPNARSGDEGSSANVSAITPSDGSDEDKQPDVLSGDDGEPVEPDDEGDPEIKEMEDLHRKMESFDLSTRRFALMAIGSMAEKTLKDIPAQTTSIKEGEISIRTETAQAIGEAAAKMERTVNALGRSMEDVNQEIRINAARTLGKILSPLSVALVPLYNTPREIEDTLDDEKVVPDPMVQINLDQFKEATHDAIMTINLLLVRGVPLLVGRLEDEHEQVRDVASQALKQIIPPSILLEEEKSRVPQVWQEFFTTLGESQQDLYVRLLVNDLGSDSVNTARQAAKDLGDLGVSAKKALPALIRVINDRKNLYVHYKYVKIEAMKAVGSMGAEAAPAVSALLEQLDDVRFEIRQSAVTALGHIGGRESTPKVLDRYEHDSSLPVRQSALEALACLDPVNCLDRAYFALFNALKSESGDDRLMAFKALAEYETKNRGLGIIKWKPYVHPVLGYRACAGKECIDTGQNTTFRLGDFKQTVNGTDRVRVYALQVTGTRDMDFMFVDMASILHKSVEIEKDPGIKSEKEKSLLTFLKSLEIEKTSSGKTETRKK